jgi:putative membrane protein
MFSTWRSHDEEVDVTTAQMPAIESHLPSANELAAERTHLAASRNVMAADRSLMAWIRTSLSMSSFGFTIYKVLQGFQEHGAMKHVESPRIIGLFLTGLGTLSMAMGTFEYWFRLQDLRHLESFRVWRPSFIMAVIMSLTSVTLFGSIISRLL